MKDLECYIFHTDRTDSDDLAVYQCGREKCRPFTFYGPLAREYFLIHYVEKGGGIFIINNQTYNPIAGDIFLICPNEPAYYESYIDDPWIYSWVAFNGANVQEIMENVWLKSGGFIRPVFDCMQMMDNIISAARADDYIRLLGHVYLLISELDVKSAGGKALKQLSSTRLLKSALHYIHKNYAGKMSITSLAGHLYIDRTYLFRIFEGKLGISPNQYLTEYRLRRACELLRQTNLSVNEIAFSVGFTEQSHFSAKFRRCMNMAPLMFRKIPNDTADNIIEEMFRHITNDDYFSELKVLK